MRQLRRKLQLQLPRRVPSPGRPSFLSRSDKWTFPPDSGVAVPLTFKVDKCIFQTWMSVTSHRRPVINSAATPSDPSDAAVDPDTDSTLTPERALVSEAIARGRKFRSPFSCRMFFFKFPCSIPMNRRERVLGSERWLRAALRELRRQLLLFLQPWIPPR